MTSLVQQFPKISGYTLVEQLYLGSRTAVYRGLQRSQQCSVVIKTLRHDYPSFSELVQFRNQYAIARALTCQFAKNLDIPGIVQPISLEPYANGYALVMEDIGGISLRHYIQASPVTVEQFWPIALQIVDILHQLYQQRVIHKDIKPANILIQPETGEIKLIDFSIASLLPRETQEIQNPNVLEGTLAYISPEQTGRMNRGIDYRSDFYSLGITFFELLTGQLPFQADEPMEMVHAHLAKQPLSICDLNPDLPIMLSEIIRKLMAKNAEDRYQSALGLKHDLMKCHQEYHVAGKLAWFDLAERDISDRFLIPEKLYGREQEVQTLLDAFGRVANGASELMLVAGFSGIGKTAVINEVHKPIVRWHGYFIKGKYDQFNRNLPFSAFVQAFRDLMGQLLSSDDVQLQEWKTKILAAVGDNGQVLIEVIPELEQVIGPQPPVPELSGSAAQNRFNLLFLKFIMVFTTPEHPLVIFLDDLQWADSASLNLLKLLLTRDAKGGKQRGYLFVIGAYRDNEVFPAHPLMLALDEIQKTQATINTLTLAPLKQDDVNYLIADTLSCTRDRALPFTELVYQKTIGNPFFITQFLKALHEDGLITFDWQVGSWQCDLANVRSLALSDDVVEFMALQLQKLPPETQTALKLAACVGNQFDLATLAIVSEQPEQETASALWKALQEGFIIPTNEVYKFYQNLPGVSHQSANQIIDNHKQVTVSYKFLHDRVQQAAYTLIPDHQKKATHLKIGRRLLKTMAPTERDDMLFEITNQLNMGVELITDFFEQLELAQLNLRAGHKAKASTAHDSAVLYLRTGVALLPTDSWQSQYELALKLHIEKAEAEYLAIAFESATETANTALHHAATLLDQVSVYELQMQIHIAQLQMLQAVEIGLQVLEKLEIPLVTLTDQESLVIDLPDLAQLHDLHIMTDTYKLSAMQIMKTLCAPVFMAKPEIFPQIIITMVNLCIEYGSSELSSFAYGFYGLLLSGMGKLDEGFQAGKIALHLLNHFDSKDLKAKVYNLFNSNIRSWKEHAKDSIVPLQEAVQSGLETGDIEWGGYCAANLCSYLFFSGENLATVTQQQSIYVDLCIQIKQDIPTHFSQIWRQLGLNLQGLASDRMLLVGESFDEAQTLPRLIAAKSGTCLFIFYIAKTILLYQFGAYKQALQQVELATEQLGAAFGFMQVVMLNFYHSLILLALCAEANSTQRAQYLQQVSVNQEKLQFWATHAPMNNQHRYELVEAMKAQVLGDFGQACTLYDRAIAGAKANGYPQEAALANELAAKFYLDWQKERIAQAYMIEAYYGYARWGAKAKLADWETHYPQLLAPILQQVQTPFSVDETLFATGTVTSTSASSTSLSDTLDLVAILKASQTLSSEIELERLIGTLLLTVMQTSGATQCALMLSEGQNLTVQARAELTESGQIETQILHPAQSLVDSGVVPICLVTKVKRSLQPAVISNAAQDSLFIGDAYIQNWQPKSLLCSPILQQGKLLGMVYLENNLTTGAFTRDRVELLNLLCAQAAISLENARLYQQAQAYAQQLEESQLQIVQNEKMATLGNLVAGVAHEINNPVGFLNGSINNAKDYVQDLCEYLDTYQQHQPPTGSVAELAQEIDLEFLLEDLPKLIDSMKGASDRIKGISTSLRTFSRADTEHKVSANLHAGLDSTLLILKYRLKANENRPAIKVIRNYGKVPEIDCFPGQLNQVFMNILANAIDMFDEMAQQTTFEKLENHPQQITIQTALLSEQNVVEIRIGDNGKGMNEKVKSKIFDRLFTTKEVGKGTGLGLAIARQIVVEKHDGRLEVQSELGQGTEFSISLPVRG
ncbi:MAG: AAA family ATPase [Aulosira sp. DedQUE10]|nr:AAA family ATPase [Aulosira sp. DedQUE10]